MTEINDFYAALVESSDDAIVAKDTDGIVMAWNPAAERLYGYTAEEMIGQSIRILLPADRKGEEDNILASIRRGERVGQFFTKRVHKSGETLDVSITVSPVRDEHGRIVGASKIARDIGSYLEDQRRLRESEERFHLLADNISPLTWMARPDGHIFWYNRRWYDFTGTTLEDMEGWGWRSVQHPDHIKRVVSNWRTSLEGGTAWEDTFPLKGSNGEYRWFLTRAMPVRNEAGEITLWFGTNTDITEQREQAEQIRLLLLEVNHRSKNMLSTVQALARRSVSNDPAFIERFQDRVRSLALNQDILVSREWRDVPLEELARLQLHFVADAPGEFIIDGPRISLSPRAAETFGMALHELATNALKYGSLSVDNGTVRLVWTVDRESGRFAITWRENGGPAVVEPQRKGFGHVLIAEMPRRLFDAEVELDYASAGVRWALTCPLSAVEAGI